MRAVCGSFSGAEVQSVSLCETNHPDLIDIYTWSVCFCETNHMNLLDAKLTSPLVWFPNPIADGSQIGTLSTPPPL